MVDGSRDILATEAKATLHHKNPLTPSDLTILAFNLIEADWARFRHLHVPGCAGSGVEIINRASTEILQTAPHAKFNATLCLADGRSLAFSYLGMMLCNGACVYIDRPIGL